MTGSEAWHEVKLGAIYKPQSSHECIIPKIVHLDMLLVAKATIPPDAIIPFCAGAKRDPALFGGGVWGRD